MPLCPPGLGARRNGLGGARCARRADFQFDKEERNKPEHRVPGVPEIAKRPPVRGGDKQNAVQGELGDPERAAGDRRALLERGGGNLQFKKANDHEPGARIHHVGPRLSADQSAGGFVGEKTAAVVEIYLSAEIAAIRRRQRRESVEARGDGVSVGARQRARVGARIRRQAERQPQRRDISIKGVENSRDAKRSDAAENRPTPIKRLAGQDRRLQFEKQKQREPSRRVHRLGERHDEAVEADTRAERDAGGREVFGQKVGRVDEKQTVNGVLKRGEQMGARARRPAYGPKFHALRFYRFGRRLPALLNWFLSNVQRRTHKR